MSAYQNNVNYGPPPMGQMNVVNGVPSQNPPMTSMQQQQQQQSQFPLPQNIFQQKQQQQQEQQMPTLHNNMSKFMPPTTASTMSGAVVPTNTFTNGPMHPPTTQMGSGIMSGNLPPHVRPPAMNGPPGPPLVNGGGGGLSTNSSRTASPALQTVPAMKAPTMPTMLAPVVGDVNAAVRSPGIKSGPTTTSPSSNMNSLSGSIQNLNINRPNGPSIQAIPPPVNMNVAPKSQFSPGNFKATALNISTSMQPNALGSRPIQPATNNTVYNQSVSQSMGVMQSPNVFGGISTSSGIPTSRTMSVQPSSINYTVGSMPVLPPPTSAMQQNQLNNNSVQPPQPPTIQRKPMYPTSMPMAMQQSTSLPSQQPYAQAYQPQSGSQPGMFNGQPSAGPLQYQAQPPMPPQSQQQSQSQSQSFMAPTYQQPIYTSGVNTQQNAQMNVVQQGFSRLWGQDTIDLMQNRHILTPATVPPPKIVLHNQFHESINCSPNIMRCTIAKIPENNSLLQKSRLPLGILIHPFRDINSLPVIQCPTIVRCRLCRTYINPFVYFVDSKMWKCNLCYRVNELPEDFQFDPATKTYGDVTRRPEVRSSTIEFIAPSEYMLRPPQPAVYLFLFDVSIIAQQSGYLENVCAVLLKHLEDMPGDARAQVGFIAYNSQVHFYSMAEGYNQPHEMTLLDIDDPFLPRPDNLLVNMKECRELIRDLLKQLPHRFADTHDPGSALGAALQIAFKLMQTYGGRVTVFQTCLPNKGPGSLEPREDPNNRSSKDVAHLNPATDFYKRFALECSGYQVAIDLFLLNQQYSDLATISGISKYSGGCVHHFPLYQKTKPQHVDSFRQCFKRYLTRKIGFEAVMRIRCTRGLAVHTFHGNFFVRSTDLLSLPNVNPDAGYGMQITYEENLADAKTICFQAALLYTNSEGERRIRVHTLCLPVTSSLPEVMHAADTEAIVGLLAKMAVDRSLTSNLADAREAFINATVDILNAFKVAQNLPSGQSGQLIAPRSLALMPLYILALLKHPAFRIGTSTRLDDRVYSMDCMKTMPLDQLMKYIYPEFYLIDALFYNVQNLNANATDDEDEDDLPDVPRLQLSAEFLDSRSMFLLDCGTLIILYVGLNVPANVLEGTLGVKSTAELPDYCYGLPNVNSPENNILKRFIMKLNDDKPYSPLVQIIRDTSTAKPQVIEKLVDDRSESSLSYYEFLQHIRTQVK